MSNLGIVTGNNVIASSSTIELAIPKCESTWERRLRRGKGEMTLRWSTFHLSDIKSCHGQKIIWTYFKCTKARSEVRADDDRS